MKRTRQTTLTESLLPLLPPSQKSNNVTSAEDDTQRVTVAHLGLGDLDPEGPI